MVDPIFTTREKAARVGLFVRDLAAADPDDPRRADRVEAINERGRDRAVRMLAAWQSEYDLAKNALAAAKVAERAASRHDRKAAKTARREAEDRLRRLERSKPKG